MPVVDFFFIAYVMVGPLLAAKRNSFILISQKLTMESSKFKVERVHCTNSAGKEVDQVILT